MLVHRRCAVEHAGVVRRWCMRDRSVLPRWHQDDRGPANAHRGVHVVAPEGAYARVPVWSGRAHWLQIVVPVAIAIHRDVLRRHQVSAEAFRAYARVKSGYAAPRTGRRCVVRPDTVASVMGHDKRHVQRCQAAAREMGLEVVILTGRMLTLAESTGARSRGSRQRGLSTEVALTSSPALRAALDFVTPTRGTSSPQSSNLQNEYLHGLTAEKTDAAPPRQPPNRCRRLRQSRRLAEELLRIVPWLATERPGRLAPALAKFTTYSPPWTAQDVASAISTHTLRTGRGTIAPDRIRTRPAVLLAAILRDLDVQGDHPALGFHLTAEVPGTIPVACGAADCDGYGWLTSTDEHNSVVPCPRCPQAVRISTTDSVDTVQDLGVRPDGLDPPF
ncbi:MAG: hypothetical protein ACRC35_14560 [Angustibacter sp.]